MTYKLSRQEIDLIVESIKHTISFQIGVSSVEEIRHLEVLQERFTLASQVYLEIHDG